MTLANSQQETDSQVSETPDIGKFIEGLDVLPPWSQADVKQRLRSIGIYLSIYFPVAFTIGIAIAVFLTMLLLYVYPLVALNQDDPAVWYWHSESELRDARIRGWIIFSIMVWITFWFFISFFKAMFTDAGRIPERPEWALEKATLENAEALFERRKDGDVRHCMICVKIKPDRVHHCRLCDVCVLKMDHHCPWIAACVGFYNYKYFFLVVSYGLLGLLLFAGTFWETVVITLYNENSSTMLCLYVVGAYSLGCLLAVVLGIFWVFHCYLISNSITTIEFLEKRKKWENNVSIYRLPLGQAWQEALGENRLTWMFPFRYRESPTPS